MILEYGKGEFNFGAGMEFLDFIKKYSTWLDDKFSILHYILFYIIFYFCIIFYFYIIFYSYINQ